MTGLVEFLTARLDEDEAVATAASGQAPWSLRTHEADYLMITGVNDDVIVYDEGVPSDAEAAHIVRNDPARVLAEVAAKRAILDEHAPQISDLFPEDGPQWCQTCARRDSWPCPTVRALLQPYADHSDFDESWRVAAIVPDRETT